jgi:hypothetical protein
VNKACGTLRDKEFLIPQSWDEEIGGILVSPNLATLQWVSRTLSLEQVQALLNWNNVPVEEKFKSTYSFSTFRTVHMNYSFNYFSESKCALDRILVSTLLIAKVGYGVLKEDEEMASVEDLEAAAPARRAHKVFPQIYCIKKLVCFQQPKGDAGSAHGAEEDSTPRASLDTRQDARRSSRSDPRKLKKQHRGGDVPLL